MRFDSRGLVSTYLSEWMPTGDNRVSVGGYFAGGDSPNLSSIEKITFATDADSVLSATLTSASSWHTGYANSGVAGYVNGGEDSTPYLSRVDKVAFPADTKSTTTALSYTVEQANGFANSGIAGYIASGFDGTVYVTTVLKNTFPADTMSTTTALSTTHAAGAGFSNNGVAGYVAGGKNFVDVKLDTVEKLTFTTDTRSSVSGTLTSGKMFIGSGFADIGVAGYVAGGVDSVSTVATVDKFAFPTDTKSTTTSLSAASDLCSGFANTGVAGYVGLGRSTANPSRNVDKFSFPTDTLTTLTNVLTTGRKRPSGFADCGVF